MKVFVRYPDFMAGVFGCRFLFPPELLSFLHSTFGVESFLHPCFYPSPGLTSFRKLAVRFTFSSPFAILFLSCILIGQYTDGKVGQA